MKSISKILAAILILLAQVCYAQIKNSTTETFKINGNCGMCKNTIEKAGNVTDIANVNWSKVAKTAIVSYDSTKTNKTEILKRIALAGYDNESFSAPDNTYASLPNCCHYERNPVAVNVIKLLSNTDMGTTSMNHATETTNGTAGESQQLTAVFNNYFALKDALVETNGVSASEKSKDLSTSINSVEMGKLPMDVHIIWMKVLVSLKEDVTDISNSKEITEQRNHFINLSKNIYELIKVAKYEQPIYYQFCPMANKGKGANWLSKENEIKNPYYGSKMLSCGKIVETIQ